MADWGQMGESTAERAAACRMCEAMLPDAVDGTLTEAEQRVFDRHVGECTACSRQLEEAQRGAAWLGLLKRQAPEPSPLLLERILAQTIGAQAATEAAVTLAAEKRAAAWRSPESEAGWAPGLAPVMAPVAPAEVVLPAAVRAPQAPSRWKVLGGAFSLGWMRSALQPRMAMTAAMAFFSIALTLNLTGVRLNQWSAASLRPANLRRVVADRSAAAVRGFQNMRVVYQAEAQVNDLRNGLQSADENTDRREDRPETEPKQPEKPQRGNPQGSSQLNFEPVGPVDLRAAGAARQGA